MMLGEWKKHVMFCLQKKEKKQEEKKEHEVKELIHREK